MNQAVHSNILLKKQYYIWVAFGAYILLNVVLLIYHEPWRDEAQAWLLARDLSPWQLILRMSDEGHPALWHFILMPFAKLGFPFRTIGVISLIVMSFSAYFMLSRAPFHPVMKVLLLFSPAFVYYYPVISRSYCLIAWLLTILAIVYPKRHEKPLRLGIVVALLIQTHGLVLGFAAMVCLIWLCESLALSKKTKEKIRWKSILFAMAPPILSVGAFVFQTMREVNTNVMRIKEWPGITLFISQLISTIGDSYSSGAGFNLAFWKVPFLFLLALIAVLFFCLKNRYNIMVLIGAIAFEYFVYTAIYSFSVQKLLTISFFMVWFWWIAYFDCRYTKLRQVIGAAVCVYCLVIPVTYVPDVITDIRMTYSDGVNAAHFIQENVPSSAIILAPDEGSSSPIFAELKGYTFYKPQTRQPTSFASWGSYSQKIPYPEVQEWIAQEFAGKEIYLILSMDDVYIADIWGYQDVYEVIYTSDEGSVVSFERYYILKINNEL